MSDPTTTPLYPVQTAMQEAVGDLPPDLQRFVVERVKKFLRALPCDGTSVPVTGARYEGKTTNYDPSILASYIGSWPL